MAEELRERQAEGRSQKPAAAKLLVANGFAEGPGVRRLSLSPDAQMGDEFTREDESLPP
jgi:hypothetical protein